jgi:hypothetical protein
LSRRDNLPTGKTSTRNVDPCYSSKEGTVYLSKYVFSPDERYAVYTAYGEKCYMCRVPVAFSAIEVDHVVPESLAGDPGGLAEVRHTLGNLCLGLSFG